MPGFLSNYATNKVLDLIFGGQPWTPPATIYVGLSIWPVNAAGYGVNEPSGGSYARVPIANTLANFPAASNGAKTNGMAIAFPAPTGNWGTVAWVFFSDAPTGGNILARASLNTTRAINGGDPAPSFATGALSISNA